MRSSRHHSRLGKNYLLLDVHLSLLPIVFGELLNGNCAIFVGGVQKFAFEIQPHPQVLSVVRVLAGEVGELQGKSWRRMVQSDFPDFNRRVASLMLGTQEQKIFSQKVVKKMVIYHMIF